MSPKKSRNFDHMKGDAASLQKDIQVRCVVEFDDDETFRRKKNKMAAIPGNKMAAVSNCPAMQQRLARHLRECRGKRPEMEGPPQMDMGTSSSECPPYQLVPKEEPKTTTNQEVLTDFFGKSITLSPSISMDDKLTSSYTKPEISKSAAREEHIRSKHGRKHSKETQVHDNDCQVDNAKESLGVDAKETMYELKSTETVILHSKGQYSYHLQTVILQWLMEIPVIPSMDEGSKIAKQNAFNELNEAICSLSGDINDESYEDYVKSHISKFVERLPIWYMCTLKEQDVYKAYLINNLFQRIKMLNLETLNESSAKKMDARKNSHRKTERQAKIEELVVNSLKSLKFVETDEWGNPINMKEVKKVFMHRLKPAVKAMSRIDDSKVHLKTELIKILRDIPLAWPPNTDASLDKYADELANKILVVAKHVGFQNNSNNTCIQNLDAIYDDQRENDILKNKTIQNIIQFINTVIDIDSNGNSEDEMADILRDSYDSIQSGNESDARSAIYEYLYTSYNITKESAATLANTTVEKMKCATKVVADKSCSTIFLNNNMLSTNVTVYVSDQDLSGQTPSNYLITSTPKKDIPKLNAEELSYIDELSKFISSWIDTIPVLGHVKDDKNYKEVMVSDLAGHLTDEVKLEQYEPDHNYYGNRENMISCTIRRWLIKFEENAFKILEDISTYVNDFIKEFNAIAIPDLTRPQHGNRNDMKNLIFREEFTDENINFVPDSLDIIEDGISIWMNEQPSHIYLNENRDVRNELLHNFATKILSQLKNKRPSDEIKLETKIWLDKMLKPDEKKNLDNLSEDLINKIIKMPITESFESNNGEIKGNTDKYDILFKSVDENEAVNKIARFDLNKTLKDFIDKFIEHNCEEDDSLVKAAYCEILKTEFRKYSPQDKAELYANSGANFKSNENLPFKLKRELYYIKEISDWLKNIPIDNSFNDSGNQNRIDFVINLARDISEVEMQKMEAPDAMNYDDYLSQLICGNYVRYLPILTDSMKYKAQIAKELINKIVKNRDVLNQKNMNKTTYDSFEMQEQNIGEFIDEYIRINGKEVADDPAKLEVWNARLLKEINRMVQVSEPTPSLKMKVYNRLAEIPIPNDDSVNGFNRKLDYAHEIGDWIKNMPIQPVSDQKIAITIIRMINDLAEKLSEKQLANIKNDSELTLYVTEWILALPLESGKAIDTAVLIEQLSKRINKVNESKNQSLNISHNKNKSPSKKNNSKQSVSKNQKRNSVAAKNKVGSSGELVVEAIEDWCKKLPIKGKKNDDDKLIKDNVAVRLFQKVGDLSLDPRFNDDILYRDQLNNDIEDIFKNLQQYNEVIKKKETLKSSLINDIINARDVVKERTAGDQYRHKLENTIEASIPAPITNSKVYDPGFELYKNKLANMFILENFDHGDDPVKLKYEVKIKDEIDKYFSEAQKRNAIPLNKDDIYNELYSALFKVPIPNEKSVIQEVEEVKLRCEIDGWFESLPIREAVNLNELLDWDQILSMLTKRIYEIENNESKAEDIIHKEVSKWLVKFPLLPGNENNIDKHVKSLVDRLKASKNERKCTPKSKKDKGKGKSSKKVTSKRDSVNKTQSPSEASFMWRPNSMRASHLSGADLNPCCVAASTPKRKPADIILDIVENWCQSLPIIPKPGENERTIKDDLMTKILRKLSELNANPEIFDDDFLYDDYLDDELDRLMNSLLLDSELQQNTEFKKFELVSALKTIKPLIRAEKARYKYKKEIRSTVRKMLQGPLDKTPEKALFEDLVDEIADSFVQYNYNKNDHEEKHIYKNRIRDAIIKYYTEVDDKSDEDSLMKQNKLICELGKIPNPGEEAIKEEVEEIKMKEEVSIFVEEVIPNETTNHKKIIKTNLSKRLHDLEKSGHSCAVDKSMKEEIARSFKKVNSNVDADKVDGFVNTLKNNEPIRKLSPRRSDDQTSLNISQQLEQHGWKSGQSDSSSELNFEYQPPTPKSYMSPSSPGEHMYQPSESIKYHTLLPENPGYRPPKPPGRQATQWYRPDASNMVGSQEWHTLPPLNPSQRLREKPSKSPSAWHSLPSSSHRPSEIQSSLTRPKSLQSFQRGPDRSVPIEPSPVIPDRNLPRTQARGQSLDIPPTQRPFRSQRRSSLEIPLHHDIDLMYDKTRYEYIRRSNTRIPQSYREVCPEPQRNAIPPHSPTNNSPSTRSPQTASRIPRPISSSKMSQGRASVPTVSIDSTPVYYPSSENQKSRVSIHSTPVYYPSPEDASSLSPRPTPAVESMSSRPVQSYQGFQNAVEAVSSPTPRLASNIPISGVPQSTRNAASIRSDAGPTISSIPRDNQEDVSPPVGTHRMGTGPQMTNPPRKRRRSNPDEEAREDFCDCFLQGDRKRRCMPLSGEWGGFPPLWCFMPVPSFCFF